MTQSFPTSPEIIYQTLTGDAQFVSLLGTYTFRQGDTVIPAISVVTPGSDLPSLKETVGLECVIHDTGTMRRKEYIAGQADIETTWSVYLICWESSDGSDLTAAAQRAIQIFAGSSVTETVAVSDGLGAMAQMMVTIRSDMPILAA